MNKYFLAYDVYERHRKIGSLIEDNKTVLDVGGEFNHLSLFCRPAKIVVANLTGGDVIIRKDKLPFEDRSFDIVSAIDVLEHVPRSDRVKFTKELLRVAKEKVLLSFPVGTRDHLNYEDEILKWLEMNGKDVSYLSEHVRFGLPRPDELKGLTHGLKTKISYSGKIGISRFLFKIFMYDLKVKILGRLIYFLKLLFNFLTNPIFYFFLAERDFQQDINRAYLVIAKLK